MPENTDQKKYDYGHFTGIYLLKVKNRNTRTRCEIYSTLTIKTAERRHWRGSAIFIVKYAEFGHISHLCSSVSIVNFEHAIVGWVTTHIPKVSMNESREQNEMNENINHGKALN